MSSCKRYLKNRIIISNLSRKKDLVILKQDKERGVVIMNLNNYTEKCMSLVSCNQFYVENDLPKSMESKVQHILPFESL